VFKNASASSHKAGRRNNYVSRQAEKIPKLDRKGVEWAQRSCGTKKAIATRREAKLLARQQSMKSGEDIISYSCALGHHYHIGHRKVDTRPNQTGAERRWRR
jgi:hypothetical protein